MTTSRSVKMMTSDDQIEHNRLLVDIVGKCSGDMSWTKQEARVSGFIRFLRRNGMPDEEIQACWSLSFNNPRPRYRSFGPTGWRDVGPDDDLEPKPHVPGATGTLVPKLVHDVMEYYQVQQLAELALFDVEDWAKSVRNFAESMKPETSFDSDSLLQTKSRLEQLAGGERKKQVEMVAKVIDIASARRLAIYKILDGAASINSNYIDDKAASLLCWLYEDSTTGTSNFSKLQTYLKYTFPKILDSLQDYQRFFEQCEPRLQASTRQSSTDGDDTDEDATDEEEDFHDTVEEADAASCNGDADQVALKSG